MFIISYLKGKKKYSGLLTQELRHVILFTFEGWYKLIKFKMLYFFQPVRFFCQYPRVKCITHSFAASDRDLHKLSLSHYQQPPFVTSLPQRAGEENPAYQRQSGELYCFFCPAITVLLNCSNSGPI